MRWRRSFGAQPRRGADQRHDAQVPAGEVLDTGPFDYDKAEIARRGGSESFRASTRPETEEYGISSFTYRTSEPFDADKLYAYLHEDENWEGVLRSKGFFWIAADHGVAYEWAQAGGVNYVNNAGHWWAAVPQEYWEHPEGQRPDERPDWHPLWRRPHPAAGVYRSVDERVGDSSRPRRLSARSGACARRQPGLGSA